MSDIKTYIVEKSKKVKKEYYYIYGNVPVYLKDTLPNNINITRALQKAQQAVPRRLVRDLEMVIIGHIPEFEERQINALYKEGTVYITNAQSSTENLITDLIHELAHCAEEYFAQDLYADMQLENEFIQKRKKLYDILLDRDFKIPAKYFLDPEYDQDFDMFLYTVVGYPVLLTLTYDLFMSPYAITSLREYFAKGFEEYVLGNEKNLKDISPILYNRLKELIENED
jgi:hypothetical protein